MIEIVAALGDGAEGGRGVLTGHVKVQRSQAPICTHTSSPNTLQEKRQKKGGRKEEEGEQHRIHKGFL